MFDKVIRVLTVAPLMACLLLAGCLGIGSVFCDTGDIITGFFCLTILPLLAYPMQPVIPKFKDKGRDGQRDLAIVFAVVGYVIGTIYCLLFSKSREMLYIFLSYFVSGVLIFVSTALHLKASGHACGIIGPMMLAAFLHISWWWVYIPLYVIVMIASIKMKRHTPREFILGGLYPAIVTVAFSFILI